MTAVGPDLPAAVAAALVRGARSGHRITTEAAGIPFSAIDWGDAGRAGRSSSSTA